MAEDEKQDHIIIPRETVKIATLFLVSLSVFTFLLGVFVSPSLGLTEGSGTQKLKTQNPGGQGGGSERVDVSVDDDPTLGKDDAPVTVIEFSDYQCPFCNRFFEQTFSQIKKEYIDTGKIRFVYRDFPLEQLGHVAAEEAAVAANCAGEQDKYWEMHDKLFQNQEGGWGYVMENGRAVDTKSPEKAKDFFRDYAKEIGLDMNSFNSCLNSSSQMDEVKKDMSAARAAGVGGTPTFFIGTPEDGYVQLTGAQPFSTFQQVIDQELNN